MSPEPDANLACAANHRGLSLVRRTPRPRAARRRGRRRRAASRPWRVPRSSRRVATDFLHHASLHAWIVMVSPRSDAFQSARWSCGISSNALTRRELTLAREWVPSRRLAILERVSSEDLSALMRKQPIEAAATNLVYSTHRPKERNRCGSRSFQIPVRRASRPQLTPYNNQMLRRPDLSIKGIG
jgi:hypothetical protein